MTFRRIFSKVHKTYRYGLDVAFSGKYLFYTNVLLSMAMSSLGDLLEQSYEIHTKQLKKVDLERTRQMALSGCSTGIICHHWYKFLDKIIVGRTFDMVLKKLILDQCICSPTVILAFFATVAIFEDDPIENFTEEVRDKFWILYKAEWLVWPPAQIINFYFLPTKYRVVYDNAVSLGYDVYTSQIKHSKPLPDSPESKDNQSH